jgi:tetratricopeptide (TPR) repeat protein
LANVLLASWLVWDEWLPPRAQAVGLGILGAAWLLAWLESGADVRRWLVELSDASSANLAPAERSDVWFREAQQAYLAGDWVAAEQTLRRMLKHDPRDAESRLMLATLWRHEGRLDDARKELDRLEQLETADPWRFEIAALRRRLAEPKEEAASDRPSELAPSALKPRVAPSPATAPADERIVGDCVEQTDEYSGLRIAEAPTERIETTLETSSHRRAA